MKTKNIFIVLIVSVAVGIYSCDGMNDLHQPYLDRGEIVYAAKVDSVKSLIGVESQVLTIYYPRQRVEKGLITWNLAQDSLWFDFPEVYTTGISEITITGLEEGNYTYDIFTFDAHGNRSVSYEITSNVVSQNTINGYKQLLEMSAYYLEYDKLPTLLKRAQISNAQNFGGSAWFMWENAPLPGAEIIFRYQNRAGGMVEKIFDGNQVANGWESSLTDALVDPPGQKFTHQTVYRNLNYPFETTIDLGEEYANRYYLYQGLIEEYVFEPVEDEF